MKSRVSCYLQGTGVKQKAQRLGGRNLTERPVWLFCLPSSLQHLRRLGTTQWSKTKFKSWVKFKTWWLFQFFSGEVPLGVAWQLTATVGAEGGWHVEGKVPESKREQSGRGFSTVYALEFTSSFQIVAAFLGTELCLPWLPTTLATGFLQRAGAASHPSPSCLPLASSNHTRGSRASQI
jgi:hypothetical protein